VFAPEAIAPSQIKGASGVTVPLRSGGKAASPAETESRPASSPTTKINKCLDFMSILLKIKMD
jgi:hypothetical protein